LRSLTKVALRHMEFSHYAEVPRNVWEKISKRSLIY
jgi:hypothetical protein